MMKEEREESKGREEGGRVRNDEGRSRERQVMEGKCGEENGNWK